ncbi:MAG: UvrB/UvrC motif-containing protein [Planctomycetota bacterium]
MKKKCDVCDRPATHRSIEIVGGKKIERNYCDIHAAEAGLSVKAPHQPVNEFFTSLVKMQSGGEAKEAAAKSAEAACPECDTTFAKFRQDSLLGCPHCYEAFERELGPLLERAHEGATHHVGKVPRSSGVSEQRQVQLSRLRRRLDDAVAAEDYELAARLRDELRQAEADG